MEYEPLLSYYERGELTDRDVLMNIPVAFARKYSRILSVRGILALIDHCAGAEVYVPRGLKRDSKLRQLLSVEDYTVLCGRYGGYSLRDIPTNASLIRLIRNKRIVALREGGASVRMIAKRFGLSPRYIHAITRVGAHDC